MTRKDSHKKNPHKPKRDFKAYIKFLLVAVALVFLLEYFVFEGERPYITKMKADYYAEKALEKEAIEALLPPKVVYPEDGADYFEAPVEVPVEIEPSIEEPEKQSSFIEEEWDVIATAPADAVIEKFKPSAQAKPKFSGKKPKIAIVIDDLGMNLQQSHAAINLPAEVTLALLPYAETVRSLANKARRKGHEIIIHTPMEAMYNTNPGPMALREDMDFAAFDAEFRKIADSFEGYVGINNHMGSRLTQNPEAMGYLMDELKRRGLYFFDSRTIHTSIAASTAKSYGIPFAERDVFLDHEETPEFTAKALKNLERIARQQGSAIAIGHPKAITMAALRAWIPTLEERGFELVSLTELLAKPKTAIIVVENETGKSLNDIVPASGNNEDHISATYSSAPQTDIGVSLETVLESDEWRSRQPE